MFIFWSLPEMKSWKASGQDPCDPLSTLSQPFWVPHAYLPIALQI